MKKTTKLIEVQTPKGEPIFQLRIVESVLSEGENPVRSQPSASPSPSKSPVPSGGNGIKPQNGNGKTTTDEMMTEPQKKYLFRIFEKLGVSTRVELVLYAFNNGEPRQAEWLAGTTLAAPQA